MRCCAEGCKQEFDESANKVGWNAVKCPHCGKIQMSESMGGVMCEWSERECAFSKEIRRRKPEAVECMLCFANTFRVGTEYLVRIIASVGAYELAEDFLKFYLQLRIVEDVFYKAVKTLFPWIESRAKKLGAGVIAPYGLTKGEIGELREAIKEG